MLNLRKVAVSFVLSVVFAGPVFAQDPEVDSAVSVELNTVSDDGTGCTLTFVVTNAHAHAIDQLVFEAVLFDIEGAVNRLTLFDFGQLPAERPRVRQFAVQQISCGSIGRILFNGVHTCKAGALSPDQCEAGLQFSTRSDIEVLG